MSMIPALESSDPTGLLEISGSTGLLEPLEEAPPDRPTTVLNPK